MLLKTVIFVIMTQISKLSLHVNCSIAERTCLIEVG